VYIKHTPTNIQHTHTHTHCVCVCVMYIQCNVYLFNILYMCVYIIYIKLSQNLLINMKYASSPKKKKEKKIKTINKEKKRETTPTKKKN